MLFLTLIINLPQVIGLFWNTPQRVEMAAITNDPGLRFVDAAPPIGTVLKTDSRIRLVDSNSNNVWDQGETVVYDTNNNGVYDSAEPVIAGGSPAPSIKPDAHMKLVDTNGNSLWDPGEAVVYDAGGSSGNGVYDAGEQVIAGTAPASQASLRIDPSIKYLDANNNNTWNAGESVVYETVANDIYEASIDSRIKFVDANSNNLWDLAEPVVYDTNTDDTYGSGDTVISWTTPTNGDGLKSDSKVRFVDADRNGSWSSGEAVVYDALDGISNNMFDLGELVIAGAPPGISSLSNDPRLKYVDGNNNNALDSGESLVYDNNNNDTYDSSSDPRIKFFDSNSNSLWDSCCDAVVYDSNNNGVYNVGEPQIAGTPPNPVDEPPLTTESHFKFVDANRNGNWNSGESVVYDSNNNSVYDSGEPLVAGAVTFGTRLSEPLIAGFVIFPGPTITLKTDPKVKYVDMNNNLVWGPGEAVAYDTNENNQYDPGEPLVSGVPPSSGTLLSEPVIAGVIPSIGASLKSDTKVRFVDSSGNSFWDPAEAVVYDYNTSSSFNIGDTVIAGAAFGTDDVWNPREVVVYDNGDGLYGSGDYVVAGSAPVTGTPLRSDDQIRFLDDNTNGQSDPMETVVYDSNNNSLYDSGEPVIVGPSPDDKLLQLPSVGQDALGRPWLVWQEKTIGTTQRPDIFFRMWDGFVWTTKQRVTTDQANDTSSFVLPLSNESMMIFWSSDRTGNSEIFFKLYYSATSSPYPTTSDVQLTSSPFSDTMPAALQDRYGRLWVVWTRHYPTTKTSDIYYKYHNGSSWSADFPLPQASDPVPREVRPSVAQTKDGKVWILWSSNNTGNLQLYYTKTDGTIDTLPSTGIPSGSWSPRQSLFSSNDEDDRPVLVQAKDGVLWFFFQRTPSSGGGGAKVYRSSSQDNGANWSPLESWTGTNEVDTNPAAYQMKGPNGRIWVFWNRQRFVFGTIDEIWSAQSDPIANIHDVGLRALTAAPRFVKSGDPNGVAITVTVSNYGDFTENTQLTLKLNTTIFSSQALTLTSGETRVLQYTWTTLLGEWGRYTLTATIQTVSGEGTVNQGDNTLSGGIIRVRPPGDVDGNGRIDLIDIASIALAYGTIPGNLYWNPNADIDGNGIINLIDIATASFHFGHSV